MKLGHNKRAALPLAESDKPPISRFREWQFGVAAFTVGNAANFLSFGELRAVLARNVVRCQQGHDCCLEA